MPPLFLVATDLSPGAVPALALAVRLAAVEGGRVLLLHVCAPPRGVPARSPSGAALRRAVERDAEERLHALADAATTAAVRVCSRLVTRPGVAAAILSAADAEGADLVVLGTRGWGRRGARLGTVAAQVAARAARPVIAVPSGYRAGGRSPDSPFGAVVVPVDGSPAAAAALRLGHALARRYGARLRVLHVADEGLLAAATWGGEAVEAEAPSVAEEVEHRVRRFAEAALGEGAEVELRVAPAQAAGIRDAAGPSDLLVLAPHTGAGLTRRVLAGVPCPVLVVHPKAAHTPPARPRARLSLAAPRSPSSGAG